MSKLDAMLEAERRGILPQDKIAALQEARRRGLIPGSSDNDEPALTVAQSQERSKVQQQLDKNLAASEQAGAELESAETISRFARPVLRGATDLADGALALPSLLASVPVAGYNVLTGGNARVPTVADIGDSLRSVARLGKPDNKPGARERLAPQNDTEQLASTVTRGVGGVLGGLAVGGALAGGAAGAGNTAANVGRSLLANPGLQTAGAVTGGLASEYTRRKGGGAIAQTIAGIAGGAAPSLASAAGGAAIRGAVRGGEAGRKTVEQNLDSFGRAGTTPSVGQATEGRFNRAVETLLSRIPGAAGRMAKKATAQSDEIGAGIDAIAGRLSGKASAEQAGRKLNTQITGAGGFVERTKGTQEALYNNLDQHLPAATPTSVANTQRTLSDLTRIDPGAARTTSSLVNPKLKQIADDLRLDAQGGSVPYSTMKALRTRIGEMLDEGLVSDVPQKQLRRLYGALSEDLKEAAKQAGPAAEKAWSRANNYTRARAARLEILDEVVDKAGGPEAVFKAAIANTGEGATRLRSVMQSVDKDGQKMISATVLRRLGRSTNSQQDDVGQKFSTETFLTNWNKLSGEAKSSLFDRYGSGYSRDVDAIAKVASNLRDGSKVFKNTSGTSQGTAQIATASAGGAALASLFAGNPLPLAGFAAGVGGANLSARAMTNPDFVRWLAVSTKLPPSAYSSQLNQLAQIGEKKGDPLLSEAAEFLRKTAGKKEIPETTGNQRRPTK